MTAQASSLPLNALRSAVFAERASYERELTEAFDHALFTTPVDPVSREAAWRLSYDRLERLRHRFGLNRKALTEPQRYFALQEWAATADPVTAVLLTVHLNLVLGTIVPYADDCDLVGNAVKVLETRAVGAFLATEASWGVDLARIETEARYHRDTGDLVLHTPHPGARKFMPSTTVQHLPKLAVVLARLHVDGVDRGVHPVLCPLTDEAGDPRSGICVTPLPDKAGLWTDNAVTSFNHVRLPAECLLHSPLSDPNNPLAEPSPPLDRDRRYAAAVRRIRTGKVSLAASSVAQGRAATAIAVRFASHRQSIGMGGSRVHLLEHRVHQARLLDAVADTYAMSFLVNAAIRSESEVSRRELAGEELTGAERDAAHNQASLVKYLSTRTMERVLRGTALLCGAQGMFNVNRITQYQAFNHAAMIGEGENTVISTEAAHRMLRGHGYMPLSPGSAVDRAQCSIDDPRLWHHLALERERLAHERATKRLSAARRQHRRFIDVWNNCVHDALEFAERHSHRLALETILEAAKSTPDEDAGALLQGLAAIFALRDLRSDNGLLITSKLLSEHQALTLPDALEKQYAQLGPQLPLLTDALALPGEILNVPCTSPEFLDRYAAITHDEQRGAR